MNDDRRFQIFARVLLTSATAAPLLLDPVAASAQGNARTVTEPPTARILRTSGRAHFAERAHGAGADCFDRTRRDAGRRSGAQSQHTVHRRNDFQSRDRSKGCCQTALLPGCARDNAAADTVRGADRGGLSRRDGPHHVEQQAACRTELRAAPPRSQYAELLQSNQPSFARTLDQSERQRRYVC